MAWLVNALSPSLLAEVAKTAMAGECAQRLDMVLAILTDILRRGAADELLLLEASFQSTSGARLAAILHRFSSDAANLIALGGDVLKMDCELGSESVSEGLQSLLDSAFRHLRSSGVTFLQAMRPADDPQPRLQQLGFRKLAVLDYMVTSRRVPLSAAPPALHFHSLGECIANSAGNEQQVLAEFLQVIDRTYIDSLDCPALAIMRATKDVLQSYRDAPYADLGMWYIATAPEAVGCLILNPFRESGCLEVTYMGLTPEARGCGLADPFIALAWQVADRAGLRQLSLAVDRENTYAREFYRRNGFEDFLSEAVWGQKLAMDFANG